jgi:DNA polymerase-4
MSSWPAVIVHADLDAFYAAVEQLDDPALRGKPILIGPNSYRGVVLTASYEARKFGVGSAMPVAEARRRCPDAIMVPPRFERYKALSAIMMNTFRDFSPRVEALSLDEAFLDMSGAEAFFGNPESIGRKIKQAVLDATELHVSVGVASTKYVAKVASGHNKPNGLTVVEHSNTKAWLAPLPVQKLWGVGPKTTARLNAAGIERIGDIAAMDKETLERRVGSISTRLLQLANGEDPRRVERSRVARSIGSDRTLSADISDPEEIAQHLQRAADRIARRVRAKGFTARGIRVRLKTRSHQLLSRQCQLNRPTDTAQEFFRAAKSLLGAFDHPGPFRLVGMAAFDLQDASEGRQLDLFASTKPRQLEATIDALGRRFGANTVVRAKDLGNTSTVTDGVNLDFLADDDHDTDS